MREMEWRNTSSPYRILVSEIMLQQTQVSRVKEKYRLFIKEFPTIDTLATAPLAEVLTLWSGLGYNRRAKYLHQLAKKIIATHNGKFPRTLLELQSLPGIGISTAGALLAFAFHQDTPMIDTNIRRILVRTFFSKQKTLPSDKELYSFAVNLIPKGKGRAWNYAMLDLGATLCTARKHHDECPLQELHGKVGDFVYKKPQKKFAGSQRFYRGALLRHLIKHKRVSAKSLPSLLSLTPKKTDEIIKKLKEENLIKQRGVWILLP